MIAATSPAVAGPDGPAVAPASVGGAIPVRRRGDGGDFTPRRPRRLYYPSDWAVSRAITGSVRAPAGRPSGARGPKAPPSPTVVAGPRIEIEISFYDRFVSAMKTSTLLQKRAL